MKRSLLFVLCLLFLKMTISAQEIVVKSVSIAPSDNSGIVNPCLDANGDTCALIIIKTNNLTGLNFPNSSQFVKYDALEGGVYEVYVPTISRRLNYNHSSFLPGQIDLGEFGYRQLKQGRTYLVSLEAKALKKLDSSIIFKIEPATAKLYLDNELKTKEGNVYEFKLEPGNHSYSVVADNHIAANGMVNVSEAETQIKTITLQPIMHKVKVECNVSNARIFIDNIDYGKVGDKVLPQGMHDIRIQANGYSDVNDRQYISSQSKRFQYTLIENRETVHVHPISVRIHSSASTLYLNGKEVADWKDGASISLLPNQNYMFENEDGKTEKVNIAEWMAGKDIYLFIEQNAHESDTNSDGCNYRNSGGYGSSNTSSYRNPYSNAYRQTQPSYRTNSRQSSTTHQRSTRPTTTNTQRARTQPTQTRQSQSTSRHTYSRLTKTSGRRR